MDQLKKKIDKMINSGGKYPLLTIKECMRVVYALERKEKTIILSSDVKNILDKCNIKTKTYGIGWVVEN